MHRHRCCQSRRRWSDTQQKRNLHNHVTSCLLLLALFATATECVTATTNARRILPSPIALAFRTQVRSQRTIFDKIILLRGGDSDLEANHDDEDDDDNNNISIGGDQTETTSTSTTTNPTIFSSARTTKDDDKVYFIQQQLYLQSRSLQLRQALIQRGLHAFAHTSTTGGVTTTTGGKKILVAKKVVDWECALSTEEFPKSCLYSLDAEYGQKVIAPMLPSDDDDDDAVEEGTTSKNNKKYEWITVSSLNRLYRTDPNKVETLWYDQYAILSTWFSQTQHPYSIYTHFSHNLYATMITTALNLQPAWLLSVVLVITTMTLCGILFLPLIESCATMFLTSSLLWNSWPTWSRFTTHAALPVQLLIVQVLFGFLQQGIQSITNQLRTVLIDEECRLLQKCIPLTIIEGRSNDDTVVFDTTEVSITTDDDDQEEEDDEEEGNDDGDDE